MAARTLSVGSAVLAASAAVAGSSAVGPAQPEGVELFFTAYSGYKNDRYVEVYNGGNATANLSDFAFPNTANTVDEPGVPEFWNKFNEGAMLGPGEVYLIVHPDANMTLLAKANQTWQYLSDKNDGYGLAYGNESNHTILDIIGTFLGDSLRGWDVCGVELATDDYTLLRKENLTQGNRGNWTMSAGTNASDCDWIVLSPDNRTALNYWGDLWGKKPSASDGKTQVSDDDFTSTTTASRTSTTKSTTTSRTFSPPSASSGAEREVTNGSVSRPLPLVVGAAALLIQVIRDCR